MQEDTLELARSEAGLRAGVVDGTALVASQVGFGGDTPHALESIHK